METITWVKKNAGWAIIPLVWVAYYYDYGARHIEPLMRVDWLPASIREPLAMVVSIYAVTVALLSIWWIVVALNINYFGNQIYGWVGILCLCFGMAIIGQAFEMTLFPNINPFWHLAALAIGFWCFEMWRRLEAATV